VARWRQKSSGKCRDLDAGLLKFRRQRPQPFEGRIARGHLADHGNVALDPTEDRRPRIAGLNAKRPSGGPGPPFTAGI
jgi:hypothetical protein